MFATLVLAASMVGQQFAPNAGMLWTGNGYVLTAFDTTKPLHFQGGSLTLDLIWEPALDGYGGGFKSPPFIVPGTLYPIWLEFYPRLGYDYATWGLVERDGRSVGDYMIDFDSATATNMSGTTTDFSRGGRMWALNRAGVTTYTMTQ